jgi:hypothetical protein
VAKATLAAIQGLPRSPFTEAEMARLMTVISNTQSEVHRLKPPEAQLQGVITKIAYKRKSVSVYATRADGLEAQLDAVRLAMSAAEEELTDLLAEQERLAALLQSPAPPGPAQVNQGAAPPFLDPAAALAQLLPAILGLIQRQPNDHHCAELTRVLRAMDPGSVTA